MNLILRGNRHNEELKGQKINFISKENLEIRKVEMEIEKHKKNNSTTTILKNYGYKSMGVKKSDQMVTIPQTK